MCVVYIYMIYIYIRSWCASRSPSPTRWLCASVPSPLAPNPTRLPELCKTDPSCSPLSKIHTMYRYVM